MPFGKHNATNQTNGMDQTYQTSPMTNTATGNAMPPTNLPPNQRLGNTQQPQTIDPYYNTVGNNDIAPVNHLSSGQHTGSASATTGKIEHALGNILCSQSLKAKGLQKEQQAHALKTQRVEITEAERLEHEAMLRRQRAVEFGADPSHKALGGAPQAQQYGGNFGGMGAAANGPTGGNTSIGLERGGML